ncbi:hypothetical protein JB92DRAFT_2005463 [Gautieria morchelliformis]|nr:hypothetical protein JB92DRAFT_2005463 [Gautieria morchelliformis]
MSSRAPGTPRRPASPPNPFVTPYHKHTIVAAHASEGSQVRRLHPLGSERSYDPQEATHDRGYNRSAFSSRIGVTCVIQPSLCRRWAGMPEVPNSALIDPSLLQRYTMRAWWRWRATNPREGINKPIPSNHHSRPPSRSPAAAHAQYTQAAPARRTCPERAATPHPCRRTKPDLVRRLNNPRQPYARDVRSAHSCAAAHCSPRPTRALHRPGQQHTRIPAARRYFVQHVKIRGRPMSLTPTPRRCPSG